MFLAPAAVAGSVRSAPTDPGGEDKEGNASTHPDVGPNPCRRSRAVSVIDRQACRRPSR